MNEATERQRWWMLADDLSGAFDAGAPFVMRGWRVTVPLTERAATAAMRDGELRVVSTESRNLAPADAAAEVRRVISRAGGGRLVFKKIDSTLRGPVGAELQATLDALQPPLAIFTPANPLVGRTVVDGQLRVRGQLVTETEFAQDPHWPVRESDVRRLLAGQGVGRTAHLARVHMRAGADVVADFLQREMLDGNRVVVCDAELIADLRCLVEAARAVEPATLFVGSGALAGAVAASMALPVADERTAAKRPASDRGIIFVCGSKNSRSHRQMEFLAREAGVPLRAALLRRFDPSALAREIVGDLDRAKIAALTFLADGDESAGVAQELSAAVGQVVAAISALRQPGGWFVTGGETAQRLCGSLRGESLELQNEIEPGIAAAVLDGSDDSQWIITKPGGFGEERSLFAVARWWSRVGGVK